MERCSHCGQTIWPAPVELCKDCRAPMGAWRPTVGHSGAAAADWVTHEVGGLDCLRRQLERANRRRDALVTEKAVERARLERELRTTRDELAVVQRKLRIANDTLKDILEADSCSLRGRNEV